MIQKVLFKNYKAFESGELKINPITILLGANSVGKSSIINLLLMLKQTANSSGYKSALRLHGENVSLGENKNIFRNQDITNNIEIGFEIPRQSMDNMLDRFLSYFYMPLSFFHGFPDEYFKELISPFINKQGELRKKYLSKENFLQMVSKIEEVITSKHKGQTDIINYIKRSIILNEKEHIGRMFDLLNNIKHIKDDAVFISFDIRNVIINNEDSLKLEQLILRHNDKKILDIKFTLDSTKDSYIDIDITSDFVAGDLLDRKSKNELLKIFVCTSTIFACISNNSTPIWRRNREIDLFRAPNETSIITQIIEHIIERHINIIKERFYWSNINHVSPLRAHPKRYYFLDKSNLNTSLDSLDGNSLTEILKEDENIRNKVNNWLQTFDLHVEVSTLQDIIHKLKIKQNNLDLDITDVGFGISQVLPIIVQGFLSADGSLTMIEQPEIHLHPKMQAELADLFIDIVDNHTRKHKKLQPNKYLLIETHSEYLLKRLRRRISEGKISARDVAIYFVEPPSEDNKSTIIREVPVSSNGAFEWPSDFYIDELKKDNTSFIKQLFSKR